LVDKVTEKEYPTQPRRAKSLRWYVKGLDGQKVEQRLEWCDTRVVRRDEEAASATTG